MNGADGAAGQRVSLTPRRSQVRALLRPPPTPGLHRSGTGQSQRSAHHGPSACQFVSSSPETTEVLTMAKAQASLGVRVAVFGFDPSPEMPTGRALHVLTIRQGLPQAEPEARETLEAAGLRAVAEAGVRLDGGRRGRGGGGGGRLRLVGLDDPPGGGLGRSRSGTTRRLRMRRWPAPPPGCLRAAARASTPPMGPPSEPPWRSCAPTSGTSPVRWACSVRSSPGTTCSGSTRRSTANPRGANGPSGAGSRSSAMPGC